jgi:FG-GAP-like repeat
LKLYICFLIGLLAVAAGVDRLPNRFLQTSTEPYFVASGDLNGDGYPDLVVPCRGELISPLASTPANDRATIYLTNKSPDLASRRDMKVGFGPYTAAVGDLDGDGRADIVVANFQSNDGRDLSVMYGSADRTKAVDSAISMKVEGSDLKYRNILNNEGNAVYAFPGLTSVAIADLNHDGRLDMAAVAWSSDRIIIFLNEGNRRFRQLSYATPPGPRDLAVGDFDGDGKLDLAITLYSTNMVQVWNGDGTGAFKPSQLFFSQGSTPYHLKAADVDLDGKLDLVVGNRGPSDNVAVFHNEREGFRYIGSYHPGTPKKGETTADEIRDVLVTDWDRDGIPDLVAACHISSKLIFWKGTGKTGFNQTFVDRKVLSLPGKGPRSVIPFRDRLAVAFFDSNELGLISSPD